MRNVPLREIGGNPVIWGDQEGFCPTCSSKVTYVRGYVRSLCGEEVKYRDTYRHAPGSQCVNLFDLGGNTRHELVQAALVDAMTRDRGWLASRVPSRFGGSLAMGTVVAEHPVGGRRADVAILPEEGTGQILTVIEVTDTSPTGEDKAAVYRRAGALAFEVRLRGAAGIRIACRDYHRLQVDAFQRWVDTCRIELLRPATDTDARERMETRLLDVSDHPAGTVQCMSDQELREALEEAVRLADEEEVRLRRKAMEEMAERARRQVEFERRLAVTEMAKREAEEEEFRRLAETRRREQEREDAKRAARDALTRQEAAVAMAMRERERERAEEDAARMIREARHGAARSRKNARRWERYVTPRREAHKAKRARAATALTTARRYNDADQERRVYMTRLWAIEDKAIAEGRAPSHHKCWRPWGLKYRDLFMEGLDMHAPDHMRPRNLKPTNEGRTAE